MSTMDRIAIIKLWNLFHASERTLTGQQWKAEMTKNLEKVTLPLEDCFIFDRTQQA